jgi:hypothetical protein
LEFLLAFLHKFHSSRGGDFKNRWREVTNYVLDGEKDDKEIIL